MKPDEFYQMTPIEFIIYRHGFMTREGAEWARARRVAFYMVNAFGKSKITREAQLFNIYGEEREDRWDKEKIEALVKRLNNG